MLTKIRKRDGRISDFRHDKITEAIYKAARAVGGKDRQKAADLCDIVVRILNMKFSEENPPTVEEVQDPMIELQAKIDSRGRVIIQVVDNGPGIIEDIKERIFIPFFTTKKDGSGIGLSLSRQIMRLHRGTINVQPRTNNKTIFTLRF